MKNPHEQDSPEWGLYENMISSERLSEAYYNDSQRYLKMSEAARDKANKYKAALEKLNALAL